MAEHPRNRVKSYLGYSNHFQNGATFGVMFMLLALVGETARRNWLWSVLMALGIEVALLASPYASFFRIQLTLRFVVVTLAAHLVFGVGLGLWARSHARRWFVGTAPQELGCKVSGIRHWLCLFSYLFRSPSRLSQPLKGYLTG